MQCETPRVSVSVKVVGVTIGVAPGLASVMRGVLTVSVLVTQNADCVLSMRLILGVGVSVWKAGPVLIAHTSRGNATPGDTAARDPATLSANTV